MNRATVLKQLDTLIAWLECDDEERPELFGSRDEYEWLLRLGGMARSLVARHRVDGTGHCRLCRAQRRGIRGWLPQRRVPCRILKQADFFATSKLDVVWWQVLSMRGDEISLEEVRKWLDTSLGGEVEDHAKHAAVITDERVRPYVWGDLPTGRMPVRFDQAKTQELPRIPRNPC